MKENIIIFGTGRLSSLACYVITNDSHYRVMGFTVDEKYKFAPLHEGLPVVSFEKILDYYQCDDVSVLIPVGFTNINGFRMERYNQAKAAGFSLISYISSRALTWADLQCGDNCMVYENSVIQPYSVLGDNVIVRSSVHISHHCTIGNHSFLAAGVILGGNVKVGDRCVLGLGSIVRDNLNIADRSFIGAGAVVTKDTESDCVYVGNPARKIDKKPAEVK